MEPRGAALFREIHKNTWLKRISADVKKLAVASKKSERYWVVFCVHDDFEALLEGYVEPRLAPTHVPEWTISLQTTQHISHALVPSEQEYEFVITLHTEVVRFSASSWEIMQEWVDTLRSKLREMKILSPKENLYSKLPEIRPPLLATRDPTSPLPETPAVPPAIVPGVERVIPSTSSAIASQQPLQSTTSSSVINNHSNPSPSVAINASNLRNGQEQLQASSLGTSNHHSANLVSGNSTLTTATSTTIVATTTTANNQTASLVSMPSTAMSNTLTQNLMNLLSNPIANLTNQANKSRTISSSLDEVEPSTSRSINPLSLTNNIITPNKRPINKNLSNPNTPSSSITSKANNSLSSLAKTFANNVLSDPNTCPMNPIIKSSSMPSSSQENAISLDVKSSDERENSVSSSLQNLNTDDGIDSDSSSLPSVVFQTEPIIIPRPHTSRNISGNENYQNNLISSPVKQLQESFTETNPSDDNPSTNITIIQVSNPLPGIIAGKSSSAEIFNFNIPPSTSTSTLSESLVEQSSNDNFKCNVQIIPSSTVTTVVADKESTHLATQRIDQYSTPNKIKTSISNNDNIVTTVQVSSPNAGSYGKIKQAAIVSDVIPTSPLSTSTQKVMLSTNVSTTSTTMVNNFASVTNISVGVSNSLSQSQQAQPQHYEQVFLSSTTPLVPVTVSTSIESRNVMARMSPQLSMLSKQHRSASHSELQINHIKNRKSNQHSTIVNGNISSNPDNNSNKENTIISTSEIVPTTSNETQIAVAGTSRQKNTPSNQKNIISPPKSRPMLTRGVTEVVISRPSRIDKNPTSSNRDKPTRMPNNITDASNTNNRTRSESQERRKRSSSTSDAQAPHSSRINNNNNVSSTGPVVGSGSEVRRMQPAPQPFRPQPEVSNQQQPPNRMTLREQQVFQLRREMMHPGGVRLQLRKKDCIGSIAWVDAFGAVWISGWKQKEHPMLYNALHIGDQLISIGSVTVGSSADANKLIRSTPGLYVEIIIRRVPFGRVYAIRREMEGQCLGLIRDGNTATIVDVVPNSLAARHGLPPKAQSCDGLSITFWVLTEINGRPLNLFFKEYEVRDRLNSVGRDISILVQPSDLVVKLKKQLKSLRSHKDYIVQ